MVEVYRCRYLTGLKLRVFLAVANRIVPPDGASPEAGSMATAGIVDWAMERMEPALRRQLLLLFVAVEPLGAETILSLRLPGVERELMLRAGRSAPAALGERIALAAPDDAIHLFHAVTGRRLT